MVTSGLAADAGAIARRLREREAILSTAVGGGVAVPHAQLPGLGRLVMAASIHPRGLDYPSLDGQPVRVVFCLLGDSDTAADHLAGLARLARIARDRTVLEQLAAARSAADVIATLARLESA